MSNIGGALPPPPPNLNIGGAGAPQPPSSYAPEHVVAINLKADPGNGTKDTSKGIAIRGEGTQHLAPSTKK